MVLGNWRVILLLNYKSYNVWCDIHFWFSDGRLLTMSVMLQVVSLHIKTVMFYFYMYFVDFASSYSTTKIRLPITIHALYKQTVIVVAHFVKT